MQYCIVLYSWHIVNKSYAYAFFIGFTKSFGIILYLQVNNFTYVLAKALYIDEVTLSRSYVDRSRTLLTMTMLTIGSHIYEF